MSKEYLTWDDVQLVPKYSEIESRKNCNTATQFTCNYKIVVPLIAAPMDTVCEYEMAAALMKLGGVGCVHRFLPISDQVDITTRLGELRHDIGDRTGMDPIEPICMAVGATGDFLERSTELVKAGANVLVIDVAHGHHIHVKRAIESLKTLTAAWPIDIVAGNIATAEAALDLKKWGADGLRVGIGGGSVCETRLRTGVGVPQLSCISNIAAYGIDVPIISDGGIRYTGDVAKALCAGANSVMIGSLFSGTNQSPGEMFISGAWPNEKHFKMYRGSASKSIKMEKNGNSVHVEGTSKMVEYKGDVSQIVNDITDGIRSAMSYLGASTIEEMRAKAEFIKVTGAGMIEAKPHLL